ncbi:MAG: hypothetical protein ACK559_13000, partial [bacterium]
DPGPAGGAPSDLVRRLGQNRGGGIGSRRHGESGWEAFGHADKLCRPLREARHLLPTVGRGIESKPIP